MLGTVRFYLQPRSCSAELSRRDALCCSANGITRVHRTARAFWKCCSLFSCPVVSNSV